ncbi:hypothetical protein EZJ43_13500 [Pedobacter changchengzhani]|uniref:Uncharacterized protein n=1 Tax=Pedobacter changchengzhani TaxID=2529274 RepID=A0A4R5MKL1_9SPHI|nr:hypothetical protein [Pedobacter changchengzhani]TDG35629.1 hypothetical protein EZJ43_13500 [Pedobacter changchengzhani]
MEHIKIFALLVIICNAFTNCKTEQKKSIKNEQHKIAAFKEYAPAVEDTLNNRLRLGSTKLADTSEQLKFEPIFKKEFEKFKELYNDQIDTSKKRTIQSSKIFSVKTKDSLYNFEQDTLNYDSFYYYDGFIKPLDLFLVYYADSRNELGIFYAIDGKSNNFYEISSPFDGGLIKPLVSPKLKWLLYYVNNDYETKISFISLLKIEQKETNIKYTDYLGYNSDKWQIDDAIWINENTFALKVFDKYYETMPNQMIEERHKNIRYLKVSF